MDPGSTRGGFKPGGGGGGDPGLVCAAPPTPRRAACGGSPDGSFSPVGWLMGGTCRGVWGGGVRGGEEEGAQIRPH